MFMFGYFYVANQWKFFLDFIHNWGLGQPLRYSTSI